MIRHKNTDKYLQGFMSRKTVFTVFLVFFLLLGVEVKNTFAGKSTAQVGILPFQIFSEENLDYLNEVVASDLSEQLKTKDGVAVINQEDVNKMSRRKADAGTFSLQELNLIAERTGAHFLIYGSLTKIEDNISIDVRVFTALQSSSPYKDFVEGKDLDLLLKNLGDKISHHVAQVVLASPPQVASAEASNKTTSSAPTESKTNQGEMAFPPVIEESPLGETKSPLPQITTIQAQPSEQTSAPTPVETAEASLEHPKKTSDDNNKKQLLKPKGLASDQPVNITSDRMVADNRNRSVNFLGNVVAKRDDMIIFSDQISAVYTDQNKIEKIIARGNVKINQTDRTATCQEATYFQLRQQIVMTGKPKVWQGKNIITGDKIIIFVKEDRVEVESNKHAGEKQGRVNAIIYPGGKGFNK